MVMVNVNNGSKALKCVKFAASRGRPGAEVAVVPAGRRRYMLGPDAFICYLALTQYAISSHLSIGIWHLVAVFYPALKSHRLRRGLLRNWCGGKAEIQPQLKCAKKGIRIANPG